MNWKIVAYLLLKITGPSWNHEAELRYTVESACYAKENYDVLFVVEKSSDQVRLRRAECQGVRIVEDEPVIYTTKPCGPNDDRGSCTCDGSINPCSKMRP